MEAYSTDNMYSSPSPTKWGGRLHGPTTIKGAGWTEDVGQRHEMEDGFVIIDNWSGLSDSSYLAVFDGHGGTASMEFLVDNLHKILKEALEHLQIDEALREAFKSVDRGIFSSGILESGATGCVCLVQSDRKNSGVSIYTAHVGDSRAVLCKNGVSLRLTSTGDHRPTDKREIAKVQERGGIFHEGRVNGMLAITRAFGDHNLKYPMPAIDVDPTVSICNVPNHDGSVLVLACDGLWDVMSEQDVAEIIHSLLGPNFDTCKLECLNELSNKLLSSGLSTTGSSNATTLGIACEVLAAMLVQEAIFRQSSDNITCVCVIL